MAIGHHVGPKVAAIHAAKRDVRPYRSTVRGSQKVNGIIRRSSPSLISLGAYVDAIMAGADEADADNIARAIQARPWPTYEERMAVFSPADPWKPSRHPFTPHTIHKISRADL